MAKDRKYGIKFPFSDESDDLTFVDLNENHEESIKSMIKHILLTSKNQRIRMPEFGNDLIKYIFEPNDDIEWGNIKNEIISQISRYLPDVIFNNINILKKDGDDNSIFIEVDYSISSGITSNEYKVIIKL